MKNRQYPSKEAALTALGSLGALKFSGRIKWEIYFYALDISGKPRYLLYIHENGLVELVGETLFRG